MSVMNVPNPSHHQPSLQGVEDWIFDLDNTLYPASCGLFAQIDRKMQEFIRDLLGVGADEAHRVQKEYFHRYGTTLYGLMECHDVDPAGYLDYVHAVDFSPVLANPDLDGVLAQLPGRKFIFTNGPESHVMEILSRLGVGAHFDGIFDIEAANFLPKPRPVVYQKLLDRHGIDPTKAAMIDDLPKNLVPAAALGMVTVWLRTGWEDAGSGEGEAHIHHIADDLTQWLKGAVCDGLNG